MAVCPHLAAVKTASSNDWLERVAGPRSLRRTPYCAVRPYIFILSCWRRFSYSPLLFPNHQPFTTLLYRSLNTRREFQTTLVSCNHGCKSHAPRSCNITPRALSRYRISSRPSRRLWWWIESIQRRLWERLGIRLRIRWLWVRFRTKAEHQACHCRTRSSCSPRVGCLDA